ncbi:MAG: hypothetical protein SWY16_24630 [Cyanobacteriota bacterium]|nr:hypothetical protein [Cyanobacteriota bacterium]
MKNSAILIVNLGSSDLAVKIDGYYIPVGFDRNEPNLDDSGLDDNEKAMWEQELRRSYITEELCPELGVEVDRGRFSFRELTRRILEEYEKDEALWHSRIRPNRLWGVIRAAQQKFDEIGLETVYLFATDQPEFIEDRKTGEQKKNRGYDTDTIHLFDILQKWLQKEAPKLQLEKQVIPSGISPVEQDKLLDYYYRFFLREIPPDGTMLVAIKGGTPQMQTALRMQAIASLTPKQLFVEPKLVVKRLLAGEPSECRVTSYWQYVRNQKYASVRTLLETRWDFGGAIDILKDWLTLLKFWEKYIDDAELSVNKELISRIIKTLQIGEYCLNFDIDAARSVWLGKDGFENEQLRIMFSRRVVKEVKDDERLLNIYTQCRLNWELDRAASFLSLILSFYEVVLYQLSKILGCIDEFPQNSGRFDKRDFIDAEVRSCQNLGELEIEAWEDILQCLKGFDFWCALRNQLIHSAEGISKKRMQEVFQSRDLPENNVGYYDRLNNQNACSPQEILENMEEILSSNLGLVRPQYLRQFTSENSDYYIYSAVKNWTIEQLLKV